MAQPISGFNFLPTTPATLRRSVENISKRSIAYVGLHWDGQRHKALFSELGAKPSITFYGPERSWSHLPERYGGLIPFDGRSIVETLSNHGIALCIHKKEHFEEDLPSMRVFEAAAAGCVIVADDMPFLRQLLGDSAYFIDRNRAPRDFATSIDEIVSEINRDSMRSAEMAAESQRRVLDTYCLERQIVNLVDFASQTEAHRALRQSRIYTANCISESSILPISSSLERISRFDDAVAYSSEEHRNEDGVNYGRACAVALDVQEAPSYSASLPPYAASTVKRFVVNGGSPALSEGVEVVVRIGGRRGQTLRRALSSLCTQTHPRIVVTLVAFRATEGLLDECLSIIASVGRGMDVKYVVAPATGFRSTAWWLGVAATTEPYVAFNDDDDDMFPGHTATLFSAMERSRAEFAYGGVIEVEGSTSRYFDKPNYAGSKERLIPEKKRLRFLDRFNISRLLRFDNFIQSNAWIARGDFARSLIDSDPRLEVVEDVDFYLRVAARTNPVFVPSSQCRWHVSSASNLNSMTGVPTATWEKCVERVRFRLKDVRFPATTELDYGQGDYGSVLAGAEASRRVAAPLEVGRPLTLSVEDVRYFSSTGFNEPESGGWWTSGTSSRLQLRFASAVSLVSFEMRARGAYDESRGSQLVEISCGDVTAVRETQEWKDENLFFNVVLDDSSDVVNIDVRCRYLVNPKANGANPLDERNLGVWVGGIRVLGHSAEGVQVRSRVLDPNSAFEDGIDILKVEVNPGYRAAFVAARAHGKMNGIRFRIFEYEGDAGIEFRESDGSFSIFGESIPNFATEDRWGRVVRLFLRKDGRIHEIQERLMSESVIRDLADLLCMTSNASWSPEAYVEAKQSIDLETWFHECLRLLGCAMIFPIANESNESGSTLEAASEPEEV